MAWTSRKARAVWEPRLQEAAAQGATRWIAEAQRGFIDLALVRLAPFEAPLLRRRFQEAGMRLAILGPNAPVGMADLLASARASGLWCLGGAADAVKAGEAAWTTGDVVGLGNLLGMPGCCLQALFAHNLFARPEWSSSQGVSLQTWQTNHTLHRLGLSPAPWLPCTPDCRSTLEWIAGSEAPADLPEILSWPLEWSALHGIAQVLTPVFRLVHDTIATGRKARHERGAIDAAPAEAATGLVFPFRTPRRRPLEGRRTFQDGIANITQDAPTVQVGGVTSLSSFEVPKILSEPVILVGAGADLPEFASRTDSNEESQEALFAPAPSPAFALSDFERASQLETQPHAGAEPVVTGGMLLEPVAKDTWSILLSGCRRWVFCAPGSPADLLAGGPDLFDPELRYRLSRSGLDIRECEQVAGDIIGIAAGWWCQFRDLEPVQAVIAERSDRLA
ncbi:hypothetical protein EUU23_09410 [Sphingorhabdus sp. IMCC26285]|uniref:Uncharacterized protein n=1 Tax=Sphingorhabdus profundilacus TaxID=2509718 RepID=A0A6I4M0P4_9SPHN|nr:hypothetical protein [Sphingorhabdus profundilacus]MVZ97923.1 hypothetical protein [Sphingorhabdus profundilacus]